MFATLPRHVAWLGYGGLLPFLLLGPASLLDHHHSVLWSDALYGYGAIILSFVGALHWGLAMSLPGLRPCSRLYSPLLCWCLVSSLICCGTDDWLARQNCLAGTCRFVCTCLELPSFVWLPGCLPVGAGFRYLMG